MKKIISIAFPVIMLISCNSNQNKTTDVITQNSEADNILVIQTAKDAYIYGYPLVMMEITKRAMTNCETATTNCAPVNQLMRKEEFPDDKFTDVVKPNCDTYYTLAWMDLQKEPLVLEAPNTNDRYYLLPLLDAWTNVFASPGKRTTGTAPKKFLISGPNWHGEVPAGIELLKAPTNMVWMIGRTQVNSREDGQTVVIPIQQQYKLTPLSSYGKPYTPSASSIDSVIPKKKPAAQITEMPVDAFFNLLNQLMIANPPAAYDSTILRRLESIGVGPGKNFDITKFPTVIQDSLKLIPSWVNQQLTSAKGASLANGWRINRNLGDYKTNYELRAKIALLGLGANLDADAIYPNGITDMDGQPFDGSKKNYVLHFDKDQLPPVNAFWSLTMYNMESFLVKNSISRFAIGDRDKLKYNEDGSLDIYIQHDNPGKEKENNWLPAPDSSFTVTMRLYWPKEEVLNGNWKVPGIKGEKRRKS